jgi:CheY-like chemotaxis protein
VLVCDDEPVLRILVRATLDRGNYTVLEARDGRAALALARREQPDLIVLDMAMPGLGGREVLAELRRDPGTETTPVIVLTGGGHPDDSAAMLRAGADGYLTKPFSPHALSTLVAELLKGTIAPPLAA